MNCPLCTRTLGSEVQQHHLKPHTFSNRDKSVHADNNKVNLHRICHQKIHATFSEKQLLDYYHTIDRLREHEQIQKFIKWVSKKPVEFYDKNIETKSRKFRRKR